MSGRRFLLLTLNAAGNWPPELALIRALVQRGHTVRVISDDSHAAQIAEAGADYRPYRFARNRRPAERRDNVHESEIARVLREVFLNPLFADELLAALRHESPDVLLLDSMLMTAAAAAETSGLPTAVLWHTVYGALLDGARPLSGSALDPLNALRTKLGLPSVSTRAAAHQAADAILALTYEEFDVAPHNRPKQLHYVGPLASQAREGPAFESPWPVGDSRPLIVVSYSTSFQDQVDILQRVADAVAALPVRVLITLGEAISVDELRLPENVVAQRFVSHAAVLPQASLVITHAGHGTVMAAVTAGVPMICTPMGRDQHAVSACVQRCGLGVVVPLTMSTESLRQSIIAAVDDHALRERARSFAARVETDSGMQRAIDVLERLTVSTAGA